MSWLEGWPHHWHGDTPVCLLFTSIDPPVFIEFPDGTTRQPMEVRGQPRIIDLDERDWAQSVDWERTGHWYLVEKASRRTLLFLEVRPYEKAFYFARTIGSTGFPGQVRPTVKAYALGKERADGQKEHLWFLPGFPPCGGDDIETLARIALRTR